MIAGERPAVSNVGVRAELVLDDECRPVVVCSPKGVNHYKIRLWLEGVPEDTHAVTYVLHETYRDPVREVIDAPHFDLTISTYGDYELTVNVRRRRFGERFSIKLSDALAASHRSPAPAIAAAIAEIKAH